MSKKLVAWAVGALALVLASSALQPAEARRGGHHGHHHHFGHHGFGHHHHRFHHHRHIFVAPLYGYTYSYDCYWLRRRALYTGSPYWWNRYYACISYY